MMRSNIKTIAVLTSLVIAAIALAAIHRHVTRLPAPEPISPGIYFYRGQIVEMYLVFLQPGHNSPTVYRDYMEPEMSRIGPFPSTSKPPILRYGEAYGIKGWTEVEGIPRPPVLDEE